MTRPHIPARAKAAVLALVSVTAIAGGASAALAAAGHPAATARPAASVPVVINCAGHAQTRPGQYVLACADGNSYLARLSWAAWDQSAAFGSGRYRFNDCVPSCVAGHFHSLPALTALWHAKALPGHAGKRYFARLTIIFTGSRTYQADGKTYRLPGTLAFPLSPGGGA